ncbi:uncharacterized protein LOC125648653 isoform X2 [Ostrea edulis]|uniref:uncharacterized protein LOC125648653 isoform X2 n=1 Tax=Ostrea edulis TaxID=37623 RepID=UPI0024AEB029|nr:uncharacterized protein LOC125648653 isoform X2 [Ostrea edulis]XP_056008889.1 uncharacterized protein LOC125648653 isoform X2 [Ostrea edulis]
MSCTNPERGTIIEVLILICLAAVQANSHNTTASTDMTTIATTTVSPTPTNYLELIKPYTIIAGVAVLILLLIVNLVGVIQRRKEQKVIRNYLLSLHSLLPFLRNYDDIPNFDETHGGRKKSKHNLFGNNIEEYDEIEMVARRSKLSEVKEPKHDCETDQSTDVEASQDRNTVYSLQKEILSSNL